MNTRLPKRKSATRYSSRTNVTDLQPPELPQALYDELAQAYVIQVDKLGGQMIQVMIPYYSGEGPNDRILAFIGTTPSVQLATPPFTFCYFDNNEFPDGYYSVFYLAEDLVGNTSTSPATQLLIRGSASQALAAPTYPDARSGILTYVSIAAEGGAAVLARDISMKPGNLIRFHWTGSNRDGDAIPAATYNTDWRVIVDADMRQGGVIEKIPQANILALGDGGLGSTYYEIAAPGDALHARRSLRGDVLVSWEDLAQLRLSSTYGAPKVAKQELPNFNPYNTVTVFGPPGVDVTMAVSPWAQIEGADADGSRNKTVRLNSNGLARIRVSTSVIANAGGAVDVSATAYDVIRAPITAPLMFGNYRRGEEGISAYGFTSNAGTQTGCANTVYAMVDQRAYPGKKLSVLIRSGNARINDIYQSVAIPTHPDGSATFTVTASEPGAVVVEISVSGAGGVGASISMAFSSFPARE